MSEVDRLGWAASSTFRVGDLYLGVRSDTVETDATVRDLLAAHLVEGIEAPPNYSVRLGGDRGATATPLSFLYQSHAMAIRSRRPERVLCGLVSYLSAHHDPVDGLLVSTALGLVGEAGRAVLAPRDLLTQLDTLQPRLTSLGISIVDQPMTTINADAGELVLQVPSLNADEEVLRRVSRHAAPGREPEPVRPGRYPIGGWAFFGSEDGKNLSTAHGVVAAAATLNVAALGAQRSLDLLATLFRTASARAIATTGPAAIAAGLVALL